MFHTTKKMQENKLILLLVYSLKEIITISPLSKTAKCLNDVIPFVFFRVLPPFFSSCAF